MRILKSPSIALGALLSSCIALSGSANPAAAADPQTDLVAVILVVVVALFFAGCIWRLSHADPNLNRRGDD
jgi:hypothetical protein